MKFTEDKPIEYKNKGTTRFSGYSRFSQDICEISHDVITMFGRYGDYFMYLKIRRSSFIY